MTQEKWIDCYEILQISRTATDDEIKKAYRKLSKEYHPDLNNGSEDYEEIFKKINIAYDILKKNRKEYDRTYEIHKNGTNNQTNYDDFDSQYTDSTQEKNYEEVKKDYTEAEQRAAEREALKIIVEDKLKNADEIITSKKEFLYDSFINKAYEDPMDYFNTAKEFINIVYEYLVELNELREEAINYDLLEISENIDTVIELLENETNTFPLTLTDLDFNIKKETFVKLLEENLQTLIERKNDILNDYINVKYSVSSKRIPQYAYKNIYIELKLKTTSYISELKSYYKNLTKLNLEKYEQVIAEIISTLETELFSLPDNYLDAITLLSREKYNISIDKVKNEIDQKIKWIIKLAKIITKYPKSYRLNELLKEMENVIKNLDENISLQQEKILDVEKNANIEDFETCKEKYSQEYFYKLNEETEKLWKEINNILNINKSSSYENEEYQNITEILDKISGKESILLEKRMELLTLLLKYKDFNKLLDDICNIKSFKLEKEKELYLLQSKVKILEDFIIKFKEAIQKAANLNSNGVTDNKNLIYSYSQKVFLANVFSILNSIAMCICILSQFFMRDFSLKLTIAAFINGLMVTFGEDLADTYNDRIASLSNSSNNPVNIATDLIKKLERKLA